VLDDGTDDVLARETRLELTRTADAHDVRVETLSSDADGEVARYAALLATGTYAAEYLSIGLGNR